MCELWGGNDSGIIETRQMYKQSADIDNKIILLLYLENQIVKVFDYQIETIQHRRG